MTQVVYRGVYLRRMRQGKHLVAIEPGDGVTEYIEIPLRQEATSAGLEAREKHHPAADQKFEFGERVHLVLESVDG